MNAYSYQLYSSRNYPPLSKTLQMVAHCGYKRVEGYGALVANEQAVAELATLLADNGLSMPTAHFNLDMLAEDPARVLDIAGRLGIEVVIAPYLAAEDRPSDAKGWSAFGTRLAELAAPIWEAGLGFGWHNHEFEFARLATGEFPLDLILGADERLLAELDIAWIVKGGQDPVEWIAKYDGRVVAAHIKDIAPTGEALDEGGWADVGHGILDWHEIVPALERAGVSHWIMEHDDPSDDVRFAQRAIATASRF